MTLPRWLLGFAACAALAGLPSCRKESRAAGEGAPAAATAPAPEALPAAAPAGKPRTVEIKVDDKGYHPTSAPARGGEKLVLAFTRTAESECVEQVIVQGKTTDLPLNKRVEIPVTMPATGDLVFTCGMKMYEGRVSVVASKP
ncbi:MAG TPA: cupredoxin domain-containing protein [Kofleriaceae bacterium]|nr:cupredoxin domain-containing protein [Kofleriaceae bacterium]